MTGPRVFNSIDAVRSLRPKNTAVTLGVFDGVHRGHMRIVEELLGERERGAVERCFLITFDPHPIAVTHSRMMPPMLTTVRERTRLLSRFSLDGIVVLTFDERLASVGYRAFLEKYLLGAFDMKSLVIGYDCYFGRNREGSPERVRNDSKKMGFTTRIVPALKTSAEVVSSSKIRNALIEGDLAGANRLLGHPYLISGTVVRGHGMGGDLGFPTANLSIESPTKLWPSRGVYAVGVECRGENLKGMMNIGRAPTIKALPEGADEIEVHVFDFHDDLYGEEIDVFCHAFLREERRFPSREGLVRQLERDKALALESLQGAPGKGEAERR